MAKFPSSPGVAALARIAPSLVMLPAGTVVARVYFSRSPYPLSWNQFRHFGPLNSRWDHHLPGSDGGACEQSRGIYYAARDARTCLAEVFQHARRIDRVFEAPWLVVFRTARALELIDLTGEFATRMGASMAIHSGNRARARGWARDLYAAFPETQGILYSASMHGGAPALALSERAGREVFPTNPEFHRALADDVLLDPLKNAAVTLGYALR